MQIYILRAMINKLKLKLKQVLKSIINVFTVIFKTFPT